MQPAAFLLRRAAHNAGLQGFSKLETKRLGHLCYGTCTNDEFRLASGIKSPDDLKKIPASELPELCKELRKCLIKNVQLQGGHFSSPLGVVELTVALHRVYDSPKDRIVWDIGHQGYIHKMLTGRFDRVHTVRQYGGLSGYLRRYESEHDLFGAGHSSTSIGALQGIYEGDVVKGEQTNRSYVCVIGDGSLTGGMAMEALNYSDILKSPLLIIYNDNEQSSLPTGLPAKHGLDPIIPFFMKETTKQECFDDSHVIKQFDSIIQDESTSPIFIGPLDGHNIEQLTKVLSHIKERLSAKNNTKHRTPVVLHVKTIKGLGYDKALKALDRMHVIKGSVETPSGAPVEAPKTFSDVFIETLIRIGEEDTSVVAITAGMPGSTGVGKFGLRFKDRVFDVGIAEQHAVTFSAGMAVSGATPFCCLYSTFMQRALDQIIHDVSLQNLPVRFAVDRAGYVGEDGASHHGNYDINYLRMLYNVLIMAPSNSVELEMMTRIAYNTDDQPSAVRYPRANVPTTEELKKYFKYTEDELRNPISMIKGKKVYEARQLREGKSGVAVLGFGVVLLDVMKAVENYNLDVTVVDMRFLNPLDTKTINRLLEQHHTIVTAEHGVAGGFGSAVLEYLATLPKHVKVKCITYPKELAHHGKVSEQKRFANIDVDGIGKQIMEVL